MNFWLQKFFPKEDLWISNKWWPAQGDHLKVCISLGTLNEERRSMSVSWAAMFLSRLMAVRRSEHLASRVALRVEPEPKDAPRRTASEGLILIKLLMGQSNGRWSREITSYLTHRGEGPVLLPRCRIISHYYSS